MEPLQTPTRHTFKCVFKQQYSFVFCSAVVMHYAKLPPMCHQHMRYTCKTRHNIDDMKHQAPGRTAQVTTRHYKSDNVVSSASRAHMSVMFECLSWILVETGILLAPSQQIHCTKHTGLQMSASASTYFAYTCSTMLRYLAAASSEEQMTTINNLQ